MKKILSVFMAAVICMLSANIVSADNNQIKEGFSVLTEDGISLAETIVDQSDNISSIRHLCTDQSERLVYGYDFKAGRIYRINVNMRVTSGTSGVTMSVIRPDSLPSYEFLSNRVTVGEKYKTFTMSYKCGNDALAYDTPIHGYISFHSNNNNAELLVRSITVNEVSNAMYPYQNLPFRVSDDVTSNKDIITRLTFKGYMRERDKGFCPDMPITRSEFIQGIVSVGGYSAVTYNNAFSDVSKSTLYSGFIQKAFDLGIVTGKNFMPDRNADYAFIKSACEKLYTSVSGKTASYEALGNPDISGKLLVTREEAALVLYNMLEQINNEKLEDAFVIWAEKAVQVYRNNSMTAEADSFSKELEEWKKNPRVEKKKDTDYIINVKDFYTNPASKKIINEIIKYAINSSGYKYITVGDTARNEFTSYTAPASKANWTEALIWAMINEDSPYAGNTYALTFALSYLEIFTSIIKDGDSQYYFKTKDSNYNMFFFQEYMYSYLLMKTYYPCFILPSMQNKIENIIQDAITYQEKNNSNNGKGYYANIDVMLANMYAYAGRILNNKGYIKKADEILDNVTATIYEDGGIPYIGSENEIQSYHNNIMKDVGMNYMVTRSDSAKELLSRASNYYAVTLDNNNYADYATALVFKQNWGAAELIPGVTVSSYFENGGKNKAIEQRVLNENPYLVQYTFKEALIAGAYFDNNKQADISVYDEGIVEDKNIGGARGKFGDFSYSLDFRNRRLREGYPVNFPGNGIHSAGTYAGKSSYVGVYSTEPKKKDSLSAAVTKVYSSVKYANAGRKYSDMTNVSNYSDEWFENGDKYAMGGATYSVGTYGAASMTYSALNGFIGHEMWYAEKDRLIGLLTLDALADSQIYGETARIQLLNTDFNEYDLKKNTQLIKNADGTYSYADIGIKIHDTNYIGSSIDYSANIMNATVHNSGKNAIELVFGENKNSAVDVKSGDRKYIVVEFYNNKRTVPIDDVKFSDDNGIFNLTIGDRNVVYNLSDKKIESGNNTYTHGQGGLANNYSKAESGLRAGSLYNRDFDSEKYILGSKGYYTGQSSNQSADGVLFYDSGADTTSSPSPHFEICNEENGNKYLKFKTQGLKSTQSGNVKTYYMQFSNLNGYIPFGKMLYENTDTSVENFNIEFDLKCPEESYDTQLRIEVYQNNEKNGRGTGTSLVMSCGNSEIGSDWVHHKLIFDKRARKVYLYRDNKLTEEFAMSAGTDFFRNGINLVRIYFRGSASGGAFEKDGVSRELSFDDFDINIPSVTYKNVIENDTVSVEVLNNTFEKKTARLFAAVYEGETLAELISSEEFLLYPCGTKKLELDCGTISNRKNVKLFLWDGLTGLIPYEKAVSK